MRPKVWQLWIVVLCIGAFAGFGALMGLSLAIRMFFANVDVLTAPLN